MAISKSACRWMIGGVCATNGNIMSMWKTNFNMPVPSLFSGSSTCDAGFMSARYCCLGSMSIDLAASGLCAGFETVIGDALYRWAASEGDQIVGTSCLVNRWYRGATCIGGFYSLASINVTSSPGYCCFQWYENMANIGIATWEICGGATTYKWCVYAANYSGDDTSIGDSSEQADYSAPTISTFSSACVGNIWVEGNDLHFINGNCWEHAMQGDNQGATIGGAGSIWIDNSHYVHWVGADGNDYRAKWRICQFCSSFTNGAPANPSPGASYAGSMWMDTQFGYTHLAYIGCDGNKYLAGAGNYPYVAPY